MLLHTAIIPIFCCSGWYIHLP